MSQEVYNKFDKLSSGVLLFQASHGFLGEATLIILPTAGSASQSSTTGSRRRD